MSDLIIPTLKTLDVRRNGTRVLVFKGGQLALDLPWEAARDLAKILRLSAARAEQTAKVNQVISDQALLIRKGVPIALTPNPEVFKEAGNMAAHDRDLRRYCPGGIPSGVKFGIPRLVGKPPKEPANGRGN